MNARSRDAGCVKRPGADGEPFGYPGMSSVHFTAKRVKVWSGRKSNDSARE